MADKRLSIMKGAKCQILITSGCRLPLSVKYDLAEVVLSSNDLNV